MITERTRPRSSLLASYPVSWNHCLTNDLTSGHIISYHRRYQIPLNVGNNEKNTCRLKAGSVIQSTLFKKFFFCVNYQFPVESHPDLTSVVEAIWRVISPATFRGAIADCKCVMLRAWASKVGGGEGERVADQKIRWTSTEIWIFQCLFYTF